jgi:hypothetical protein
MRVPVVYENFDILLITCSLRTVARNPDESVTSIIDIHLKSILYKYSSLDF